MCPAGTEKFHLRQFIVPSLVLCCAAWRLAHAAVVGGTPHVQMWAAILPIDVAKTRKQTAAPGSAWDVGLRRHLAMVGAGWFQTQGF